MPFGPLRPLRAILRESAGLEDSEGTLYLAGGADWNGDTLGVVVDDFERFEHLVRLLKARLAKKHGR